MTEVAKAVMLAEGVSRLKDAGFSIEQTNDFELVLRELDELGKPYLTPALDVRENDFTTSNCFWLVVREKDKPVALGGARLDDLTDTDVAAFLHRHFARHYPGGVTQIAEPMLSVLAGKVAYVGDLFVAPGVRGRLDLVSRAMTVCHMVISLKWNPSCTYAYLRKSDVDRGAAARYGFSRVIPGSKSFQAEVPPRSNEECFVALERSDLLHWVKSRWNS